MKLTDQQQSALDAMLAFAFKPDQWGFTLQGFAGTGKTTVITHLARALLASGLKIAFTAPTHKAVRILSDMGDLQAMTIHSLLGLRPIRVNDKEVLKRAGKSSVGKYDLIILDECSMVSAELFEHIERAAMRFLFVGDPAQLPPVGEAGSKTFELPGAKLTQVMRQRGEHPVLAFVTDVRERWQAGQFRMPPAMPGYNPDELIGLHVMQGEMFTQLLPDAFRDEDFDSNPDRFRVIAWRNATVDRYNREIQLLRYPHMRDEPFVEGEHVYFSSPVKANAIVGREHEYGDVPVIQNETHAQVFAPSAADAHPLYPEIPAWRVALDNGLSVWTLNPTGKRVHEAALAVLKGMAQRKECGWYDWYRCLDAFAIMRPGYAMTTHKSQGSTFENVFVDAVDILRNSNRAEAMQMLYVACSRPTHNLIINYAGIP